MAREEVRLNDMSRCTPSSAFTFESDKTCWIAREYEAPEVSGVCLMAFDNMQVPEISCSFDLEGFYAIYVGILDPRGSGSRPPGNGLKLKLSGDPCFRVLSYDAPSKWMVVQEGLWKCADLTGVDLIIAQEAGMRAGVAWIRLVPLTAEEVKQERKRPPERIIIAKVDAWSLACGQTEEGVNQTIEPYRHTDFTRIFLTTSEIEANRVPRVEEALRTGKVVFPDHVLDEEYWVEYVETLKSLFERGLDPIHLIAEKAREVGMEPHLSHRIGLWSVYENADPSKIFESPFYTAHPEWRCRDRDGAPIPKMSYAFPEVRAHTQSVIREVTERHIELLAGFNVLYIRGPVFLLYEEPLVQGFKEADGRDAREISEMDPVWLHYRSQALTEFMRGLKSLRDDLEEKYGKRLEISANVFNCEKMNLRFGLALRAWVEEGLVDLLIPLINPWPYPYGEFEPDFFSDLQRISTCKVCPLLSYVCETAKDIAERANECYTAGMDGVFFWDTDTGGMASWSVMRKLGNVDQVREWAEAEVDPGIPGEYGSPPAFPTKLTRIERLGERVIGRYYVNSGG